MAISASLFSAGCDPYPDDGEFLAGVVYAGNFVAGVRTIPTPPVPPSAQAQPGEAVGRGTGPSPANLYPYFVVATTDGSATTQTLSNSNPAKSPYWTNGTKRQPLLVSNTAPVYVFDSTCTGPMGYEYNPALDLIREDKQYPLFSDLPEVMPSNGGLPGRNTPANYSAIVEVIHLTAPGNFPCQSIKRFATAQGRIGQGGDLVEGMHEYRLFQVIDPAIALPPLPFQLAFYNQLVVPYIDMGPVPMDPDGMSFRAMPIYKVSNSSGALIATVVLGANDEAGPAYSPVCQDYTLTASTPPPPDATNMAYAGATMTTNLSSCLVCRTVDSMGNLNCPFTDSQGNL
jgi:hypothetical protein